jgi:hypothetical protein
MKYNLDINSNGLSASAGCGNNIRKQQIESDFDNLKNTSKTSTFRAKALRRGKESYAC